MRGRKATPTHLRLIKGNPQHRPYNTLEPKPREDLSGAPDWLSAEQLAGWQYALKHAPQGLLKQLDRAVLTVWVVAESSHREAATAVARFGLLLRAQSGEFYPSPYVGIMNKQALIMLKAAGELGFTPAARPRIQLSPEDTGGDDFDKLIGNR
jgi:P27 family predicted phage terminase small subunit